MDVAVFVKGTRLFNEGRVHLEDEGARALYLCVEGDTDVHRVRLMSDNTFNCTCAWGTLRGAPYGSLCSHVVGALLYVTARAKPAQAA